MATPARNVASFEPLITAFVCNWCTYTGADLAGTSRLEMAPNVRIVRLPCTGRVDPLFLVKAFERGADGVIVSGCHPTDCHYTSGNYHARRRFAVLRDLLVFLGVDPGRLVFSWVSASEGRKWQQVVDRATASIRELGPFTAYRELVNTAAPPSRLPRQQLPDPPPIDDGRGEPWQQAAESELRRHAARILEEGQADVVIGWQEGPRGVRPCFVTRPEGVKRLVFDRRCAANLATYLDPNRDHRDVFDSPAVVVKGCDARAVAGLIREGQLERDGVILVGVHCAGVIGDDGAAAARCSNCDARTPGLADQLVGVEAPPPPSAGGRHDRIAALEAAMPDERWSFWQSELSRCVRCHACRAVCPLCSCRRCVADKTRPQWIESSAHGRGTLAWHLTRALHLAGRCVGCDECQRACPVGIPLGLINSKVAAVMQQRFGYRVSDDPAQEVPIGAFSREDGQEFFL